MRCYFRREEEEFMPGVKVVLAETTPGHYFEEMDEYFQEHVQELLPGYTLQLKEPKTENVAELFELIPEADVLVIGGAGQRRPVSKEIIAAGQRLRLIQKIGTRYHQIDVAEATRRGIPVAVEPAPSHIGVAEHTLMFILALSKGLLMAHRRVVEGYYEKVGLTPQKTTPTQYAYNWTNIEGIRPLYGQTLGIIGFGDIGAEVAKRARPLGMKVLYYTRHRLDAEEEQRYGVSYRPLNELLRESDYVSLHASHTPETEGMIGREQLKTMKKTAYLINTARGALIDEEALYQALTKKWIAGAALDVFREEPTPKTNPLLKLDNVLFTPHIAVGSLPIPGRFRGVLENIARVMKGEKPVGVVN